MSKICFLDDWALVVEFPSIYSAPEQAVSVLRGKVFNHSRFEDGEVIHTSEVVGRSGRFVKTKSGSLYSLGNPKEEYEEKFPDAKRRIMESLTDLDE